MKKLILIPILAAALIGCGQSSEVGDRDRGRADVLNMPEGFNNVAHKCDGHGHRVYASGGSDSGEAVAVIADPSCPDNSSNRP